MALGGRLDAAPGVGPALGVEARVTDAGAEGVGRPVCCGYVLVRCWGGGVLMDVTSPFVGAGASMGREEGMESGAGW